MAEGDEQAGVGEAQALAGEAQALAGDGSEHALCDPGQSACGEACVDLTTDPASCGACGHDCGGGTCAARKCQPVEVADKADLLS